VHDKISERQYDIFGLWGGQRGEKGSKNSGLNGLSWNGSSARIFMLARLIVVFLRKKGVSQGQIYIIALVVVSVWLRGVLGSSILVTAFSPDKFCLMVWMSIALGIFFNFIMKLCSWRLSCSPLKLFLKKVS
jgi:hypothetical protein